MDLPNGVDPNLLELVSAQGRRILQLELKVTAVLEAARGAPNYPAFVDALEALK